MGCEVKPLPPERRVIDVLAEVLREALVSPGPHDRLTITAHLHDGGKRLVKIDVTRERLMGNP